MNGSVRMGNIRSGRSRVQSSLSGLTASGMAASAAHWLSRSSRPRDQRDPRGRGGNSGLDLTDTKRYPGSLGPVPQQGARARLWPTLSPRRLLCTWVLPAPGVRLAFRAAQPGQASKTAAAALSRWPRALGGLAHVAPTRRFSPVSHLRRDENRGPC